MKKLIKFLMGIIFMLTIPSCEKDEQPRFIEIEILPTTAGTILRMEKYIDENRSTNDPDAYNALANYATQEVYAVLMNELPGEIDRVVGDYDKYWRQHHPNRQRKVWTKIDVGCHREVYRCCSSYSEELLLRLREYCESVVNGGVDWASGERIPEKEKEIIELFLSNPDVDWQYRDRLWDYFRNFAQNPNAKAEYKKNGFLNFGWWN